MVAIDRNEVKSKEGSSRVQMYKRFNLIHSYTFELGFHSPTVLTSLPDVSNEDEILT